MIVIVDVDKKSIIICDKTVKTYPFSMLGSIKKEISGKDVIYVSETIHTDGDSVIDFISEYINEYNPNFDSDEVYIRTTGKQKYSVGYNGKKILFSGMYDIKPVSSLPQGFVENCRTIINGIKDGTFEIITENEKYLIEQEKINEDIEKERKYIKDEDFDSQPGSVDNPIEIDLSENKSFKKKK